MINLIEELDRAQNFIRITWENVVMGNSMIPGAPVLKFDNIQQRTRYAESIKTGAAIDMPESGQYERKILALDPLAEKTEKGYPAWDMKPMLLGGPKARLSKKGMVYNIIPFRHGVPGNSGENAHFKNMPQDIYTAAKALKVSLMSTKAMAGTERKTVLSYGERLKGTTDKYPPQLKILSYSDHGQQQFGTYRHKTGIYEGMVKLQANYGKTSSSKYLTFRIVSENSPEFSWWHPGRPPQPHLQFVTDFCLPKIEKNLSAAAERDFLGLGTVGMDITVE